MRKSLFYLGNLCFTMAMVLALWLTNGFQQLAAWQNKPVLPFLWAMVVVTLTLGLLLLPNNRFSIRLEARSRWEIWGRATICGLMIGAVWAALYLADWCLKEFQVQYRIYLVLLGLAAALGLGLLAVVSESFLRRNLVAIGWVAILGGTGFLSGPRRLLAHSVVVAGLLLILTITLATGRLSINRKFGGQVELTREHHWVWFWLYVMVLVVFLVLVIYNAARIALG